MLVKSGVSTKSLFVQITHFDTVIQLIRFYNDPPTATMVLFVAFHLIKSVNYKKNKKHSKIIQINYLILLLSIFRPHIW